MTAAVHGLSEPRRTRRTVATYPTVTVWSAEPGVPACAYVYPLGDDSVAGSMYWTPTPASLARLVTLMRKGQLSVFGLYLDGSAAITSELYREPRYSDVIAERLARAARTQREIDDAILQRVWPEEFTGKADERPVYDDDGIRRI